MKRILTLLFCLNIVYANATTFVSGIISTNTTWTKANSPYVVNGNLSVDSGVRLTIQPGVVVMVDSSYAITIDGSLMAKGTTADSIIFTSSKIAPSRKAWQGITFSLKTIHDTSRLYYCRFEYASSAIVTTGTYWLQVYYSLFRFNTTAIHLYTQNPNSNTSDFNYNKITLNDTGVYSNSPNTSYNSTLARCEVSYNTIGMRQENTYGIRIALNSFNYNMIGYSSDGAAEGTQGNKFIGNVLYGVYVVSSPANRNSGYISNNLFLYHPTAIYIDSVAYGHVYGNTIAYNGVGVENNKTYRSASYSSGTILIFGNCYSNNNVFNFRTSDIADINTQGDYWGTASIPGIDSTIYDYYDNATLGKLRYTNISSTPTAGCQTTSAPPPCYPKPDSVIANVISPFNANISWPAVSGATAYEYYVIPSSSTPPSSGTLTFNTSFSLTGLTPGQTYQACVRTRCQASPFYSAWQCKTFTMPYPPCNSPAHVYITNIGPYYATISWDTAAYATQYEYYVLPHPSSPPASPTVTTARSVLEFGFYPGTLYDVCVRAKCGPAFSDWICDTFRTTTTGINTVYTPVVSIYPNPNKGTFTVSLQNNYGSNTMVTVYDMMGKEIYQSPITNNKSQISLGDVPKGVYMVKLQLDDAVITQRVTVE
ncbi:MAG: T9SS type A sorting domain-containing protein [Bacteroidetes bacterium]|nr:T9SS type A sorting domain-containing protein [Bacteroidota bacterium]